MPIVPTIIALVGLLLAAPATAETVFACHLGTKTVTVADRGAQYTYRFGVPGRPEITITALPHYRTDRYAGIEQQLRFTRAAYSYIVYSMDANGQTGSLPVSGLVVKKGARTIAEMACKPWVSFAADANFDALPQDDEAFSAMGP